MFSVLYACLICINFNKCIIHTLIKHIFDGSSSHTLLNAALSIYGSAYVFTLLLLSLDWVLDIPGRRYTTANKYN